LRNDIEFFRMCKLFRKTALKVVDQFHLDYAIGDEKKVITYLDWVRVLPKDAKEIY